MQLLTIELKEYNRIALNNIRRIRINFTEKVQLILGTNGSGKSSLMKELTPLPANPADYNKGGYKIITYRHNNSHYVLSSLFNTDGVKHKFEKDGENLNPGGTISVQKELVKQHFGITQDIHDLLTGLTRFHRMGPGERRVWFTRLSDTDYNYAIQLYSRIDKAHRDTVGAIRVLQARSVQEANKLLSPAQEQLLREEILQLRGLVDELLHLKPNVTAYTSDLEKRFTERITEIGTQAAKLRSIRHRFTNKEGFQNIGEIDDVLSRAYGKLDGSNHVIHLLSEEINKLQQTHDTLSRSNIHSLGEIDQEIQKSQEEVNRLMDQTVLKLFVEDPTRALQSLENIHASLADTVLLLPEDKESNLTRARAEELQLQGRNREAALAQIRQEQTLLTERKREMEHYKTHDAIECPQCKHRWYDHFDVAIYETILEGIKVLNVKEADLQGELAKILAEFQHIQEYQQLLGNYRKITTLSPDLECIWRYISDHGYVTQDPKKILQVLDRAKQDFTLQKQILTHHQREKELLGLKSATLLDDQSSLEELQIRLEEKNRILFDHQQSLSLINLEVEKYRGYKKVIGEIQALEASLTAMLSEQDQDCDLLIESKRRDGISNLIRELQFTLTTKEQQISQINLQRGVVENIHQQLKELEVTERHLKILSNELSPSVGLIAKGLSSFITQFVRQMNSFIERVWLYPMVLVHELPADNESIDLDYKFSVRVADNIRIPDIAKCSTAMKEIIDLAFLIVGMNYLGLGNSPLFLDEFSSAFDQEHRISAFRLIGELAQSSNFSQIYLVSHYTECYGSLTASEITVLCEDNVNLPKGTAFNRHVEFA